ncbi:hypothetical protein LCGC14_1930880 [marine sediment metagenome]|uniref:Uncharacterized protein n=1 Tax=marine sediment metagenome TaxID=412755 RepID=A0A0F9FN31_9ZZZZ
MPGGYLHGWNSVGEAWTKLLCNADGELLIDPSAIFEDAPTNNELEKAPTSNWAYDHENDTEAHHDIYTDAMSRAAIGNQFDSVGKMIQHLDCYNKKLNSVHTLVLKRSDADTHSVTITKIVNAPQFFIQAEEIGVGLVPVRFRLYQVDHYSDVIHEDIFQAEMALYLEEAPTDGEVEKAPTSNWAHDHAGNAAIHDVKYTNLEAQTACKLNGDLYLSIPAVAFSPTSPNSDQHTHLGYGAYLVRVNDRRIHCAVTLPHGVTVTACLVEGSNPANDSAWVLQRVAMGSSSVQVMATANVQTEDTSISDPVIDNSGYMYLVVLETLQVDDLIYCVRIKYTL